MFASRTMLRQVRVVGSLAQRRLLSTPSSSVASSSASASSVDWGDIARRAPPSMRPQIALLRKQHDDLKTGLEKPPSQAEQIDWDYYKSRISNAELLEEYRSMYETEKVEPVNPAEELALIQKEETETLAQIEKVVSDAAKRLGEVRKSLAEMEAAKSVDELRVKDVLKDNRELEKKIHDDIKNSRWL